MNKEVKNYNDLEQRDLMNRMAILVATKGYVDGRDTIQQTIEKLYNMRIDESKVKKDYSHQIPYTADTLELLITILRMKKLEKKRSDAMFIMKEILTQVDKLNNIIGEK